MKFENIISFSALIIVSTLAVFGIISLLFGEKDALEGKRIVRCETGRECYIEGHTKCVNNDYKLFFNTISECENSIH